jgi:phage baseplate assembly protein V
MGLMNRAIARALAPLARRVQLLVSRAVVRLVDASYLCQELQLTAYAEEVLGGIEHAEPYGYTAHPLPGAEALIASLGGRRSHSVAFVVGDRRFRVRNLAPGEVALYTDEGDTIHFRRGQVIDINAGNEVRIRAAQRIVATCAEASVTASTRATVTSPEVAVVASAQVTLDTPLTQISGQVTVAGLLAANGGLAVQPGAGAAAAGTITGDLQVVGGDVTADGISLKGHTHPGDSGGTTGSAQ